MQMQPSAKAVAECFALLVRCLDMYLHTGIAGTREFVMCSVIVGTAGYTVGKGVAVPIAMHSALNVFPSGDSCLSHLTRKFHYRSQWQLHWQPRDRPPECAASKGAGAQCTSVQ